MDLLSILGIALILLGIDAAIELALLSSMVGYLHRSGANEYPVRGLQSGSIVLINAKPHGLGTNEGHLSNGAAGTALVLICLIGSGVWFMERRRQNKSHTVGVSRIFLVYTVFTVISFLLTTSALGAFFAVTNATKGQSINISIAALYQHHGYPLDKWTPGTWTQALLQLDLIKGQDRSYLNHWLRVMKGNLYNLIPLFLLGGVVAVLSVMVVLDKKQRPSHLKHTEETGEIVEAKR